MRKLLTSLALALSAVVAFPAMDARGSDPPAGSEAAARFEGTWAPANLVTAKAGIVAAIEGVVSEMNFIKRPFARSKLTSTNQVLTSVRFQFNGAQLTYTYNGSKVIKTTLQAPPLRWKSPDDGEFYQVTTKLADRRFTQTFRGADGTKQEYFDLNHAGDTITYQAVISSPKLPKPLRYSYPLKRK